MNMKCALPAVLAAAIAAVPAVQASENETVFFPSSGRVVIPHLRLNDDIYFVILDHTPGASYYNFTLDTASVTKITPQPGDDWATAAEVVGDWTAQEIPGVTLGIFGSGSYSMSTPAEEDCPAGTETGTWTLDEETGVFFTMAESDTNGHCGLAPNDGAIRLKRVGANLEATISEVDDGVQQTLMVTLIPQ